MAAPSTLRPANSSKAKGESHFCTLPNTAITHLGRYVSHIAHICALLILQRTSEQAYEETGRVPDWRKPGWVAIPLIDFMSAANAAESSVRKALIELEWSNSGDGYVQSEDIPRSITRSLDGAPKVAYRRYRAIPQNFTVERPKEPECQENEAPAAPPRRRKAKIECPKCAYPITEVVVKDGVVELPEPGSSEGEPDPKSDVAGQTPIKDGAAHRYSSSGVKSAKTLSPADPHRYSSSGVNGSNGNGTHPPDPRAAELEAWLIENVAKPKIIQKVPDAWLIDQTIERLGPAPLEDLLDAARAKIDAGKFKGYRLLFMLAEDAAKFFKKTQGAECRHCGLRRRMRNDPGRCSGCGRLVNQEYLDKEYVARE